ncbi:MULTISPECIES: hypothetical protein [unclassified Lysobacter]|uniref:hypothetical protein n=1 Tax=unclassified Lysobacter TaxID=2635362 RepID=UPI001BEABFC3|nr:MULTISPECIES: hypothetical protein [unclassified Lysobacter]MBT2748013.1 hypothetical protein [Lysobacter sp. ISL-42]MBT2752775.1 hypothetical protein [Lysobacter sp. ISL-50]MBT2779363.1 hypothetical protein [Lysobacter sp. ISL-54]MBT2781919.1 hypothetical protein [Lysobacter sp. ISL-52]
MSLFNIRFHLLAAMAVVFAFAPNVFAETKATAPTAKADPRGVEAPSPPVTTEAAKRAVLDQLTDRGSAMFRNIEMSPRLTKEGRPYAVCGEVNMKNRDGAYVGYTKFYVPDDLEPLIASKGDPGIGAFKEALWQTVCAREESKK